MSVSISTTHTTGATLFATLQKIANDGTLGDIWDTNAGDWASSPSLADTKITLTEGSAPYTGRYVGGVSGTLSTYSGDALVTIHDDNNSDLAIGQDVIQISSGNPIDISDVAADSSTPAIIDQTRTWFMRDSGEYPIAQQRVTVNSGSTMTVAFDFKEVLNPGTDLATQTPTVAVETIYSGVAPTIASQAIDAQRCQVHFAISNTTAGSFRMKATATTTDGQTLVGLGNLEVI